MLGHDGANSTPNNAVRAGRAVGQQQQQQQDQQQAPLSETDTVEKAMLRFRRKGRVYKIITMETPLEELEEFFKGEQSGTVEPQGLCGRDRSREEVRFGGGDEGGSGGVCEEAATTYLTVRLLMVDTLIFVQSLLSFLLIWVISHSVFL